MKLIYVVAQHGSDVRALIASVLPRAVANGLRWIDVKDSYSLYSIATTLLARRPYPLIALVDNEQVSDSDQTSEKLDFARSIFARVAEPSRFYIAPLKELHRAMLLSPQDSTSVPIVADLTRFVEFGPDVESPRRERENRELERKFNRKALDLYQKCGSETGYWPNRYLRRVRREGGLAAVKYWLRGTEPAEGLRRLDQLRRLDLSVEALALRYPWRLLFSDEELDVARKRLKRFGYTEIADTPKRPSTMTS